MTTYTYDLTQDWSNTINPNGPWALLQGTTPLPFDPNWIPAGHPFPILQPAWAPSNDFGNFLPVWFKSTNTFAAGADNGAINIGNVYVHPTDYANGGGNGIANVQFITPTQGV